MTVKYVEKNPKDLTDSDASLKSISINGNTIGFDENVIEYYYGVDKGAMNTVTKDMVVATATQSEKTTVEYSDFVEERDGKYLTVQATAKDGTKGAVYEIHFREYQTATIEYSDARNVLRGNMKNLETPSDSQMKGKKSFYLWNCSCETSILQDTTHSNRSVGYALYDISDDSEVVGIRRVKVNASPAKYRIASEDTLFTFRATTLTNENIGKLVTEGKFTYVSGETGVVKSRFGYTESEDYVLGTMGVDAGKYTTLGCELDVSKITMYEGNQLLFVVGKNYDTKTATAGNTYYAVPSIEVEYIVKESPDLSDSDATLEGISVNGDELEFDAGITEYYCGVEVGTLESFTAANVSGKAVYDEKTTVSVTEPEDETNGKFVTVQATAKDGTKGEIYKIHIREYQTATIEYSDARYVLRGNMKSLETPSDSQMKGKKSFCLWNCPCETSILQDTTHSSRSVGYALYDISDDSEVAGIRSAKINPSPVKYRIASEDTLFTFRATTLTNENIGNLVTDGKFKSVSGDNGVVKSRFGYTESEDYVLGTMGVDAEKYTTLGCELDVSRITIYEGNQLLFVVGKNYDTKTNTSGNTYYAVPSIEVEYIIK